MRKLDYSIREYKNSDRDQVYSLIVSIFGFEFKEIPPEKYLVDLNDMEKIYGGEKNKFFVCEKNDEIIGTIAIKEDDEKVALLRRFFVNPKFRGQKIGKNLLVEALDFAQSKGYSDIIFIGNMIMQGVKSMLVNNGFEEEKDFILSEFSVFKLHFSFK